MSQIRVVHVSSECGVDHVVVGYVIQVTPVLTTTGNTTKLFISCHISCIKISVRTVQCCYLPNGCSKLTFQHQLLTFTNMFLFHLTDSVHLRSLLVIGAARNKYLCMYERLQFSAQRFSFLIIFLSFYFGSCGRLSWLNCQLRAHINIGSSHHIISNYSEVTQISSIFSYRRSHIGIIWQTSSYEGRSKSFVTRL